MSQAGIISTSGGPAPPAVATSYVTDSGTAVPAANILDVFGGTSTANNPNGIATSGATNIETISLTNRIRGTGTIVGAVTGDLITFNLGASPAVYRFTYDVTGRDTGNGNGVGYSLWASLRTDGATATLIQNPFDDADEDASLILANIDVIASGNNMILRATGVAGRTISYVALANYIVV